MKPPQGYVGVSFRLRFPPSERCQTRTTRQPSRGPRLAISSASFAATRRSITSQRCPTSRVVSVCARSSERKVPRIRSRYDHT